MVLRTSFRIRRQQAIQNAKTIKNTIVTIASAGIALCIASTFLEYSDGSLRDWLPGDPRIDSIFDWVENDGDFRSSRRMNWKEVANIRNGTTVGNVYYKTEKDLLALPPQPLSSPFSNPTKIKIVGFSDVVYKDIATYWYERMTKLGYNEHTIIATDEGMAHVLGNYTDFRNEPYRYETISIPPLTEAEANLKLRRRTRIWREKMFAIRWNYILEHLEKGVSILLTDVDNIFNRYVPLTQFLEFDIIHAYEISHPVDIYERDGFVVCGGMSFFKSSPESIRFVKLMVEKCQGSCDDQVILNNLLSDLNITWKNTDHLPPPEKRTQRENGTATILANDPMTGICNDTGHTVKVWGRDFAYRGPLYPETCPPNNWVSMPFPVFPEGRKVGRWNIHKFKRQMPDQWDRHCNITMPAKTTAVKLIR